MASHMVLSSAIALGGTLVFGNSNASAESNSWNFEYSGGVQSFTAPYTGTYELQIWGAQGGDSGVTQGGLGGYSEGEVNLTAGQTIFVYVGGEGRPGAQNASGGSGGWNGGGSGGSANSNAWSGGGGGGASDIRIGGAALPNRAIVAGAGGGASATVTSSTSGFKGGYGGGLVGGNGSGNTTTNLGRGGTQSTGGSGGNYGGYVASNGTLGTGGNGIKRNDFEGGGGGGAGYYGGGGGNSGNGPDGSAGGGSGYIGGVSEGEIDSGNQSMPSPTGGTETGQSGNGYAKITLIKLSDTTPPVTTNDAPKDWVNKDVTVNFTASDEDGTGVASTYYQLDNGEKQSGTSVKVTSEGVHHIAYWSVDNAGNTEEQHNVDVKIDKTAPVTTDDAPKEWTKEDVTVNLTASDKDGSGVESTFYKLDNGEKQSGSSVNVSSEGVHTITYWSVDNAGNKEDEHNVTVKIDKTGPVTTDDAPKGWVKEEVTVNLTASDKDGSGVAATYYKLDNGEQQSGSSVDVSQEGVHTIVYWSVDEVGNIEEQHKATVKIDKTAPVTTDDAPADWANKDVTVNLSAIDKDGSGIASTYYQLDNGEQQSGSSVNVSSEGVHTISYWSVDNAGNVEEKHSTTVKIDKAAPVTTIGTNPASPNGKNGWYTSDVQVSLNSTDKDGSGVSVTEYRINSGAWIPYHNAFTLSTDGTYTIDYRSTDKVGNTEEFNSKIIKLDKSVPALTINLDKTTLWEPNHKMVPVTATVKTSDGASGMESVVLTSITSNESLQSDDIQKAKFNTPITGSTDSFELRSERLGNGNGRIYTITYTATDKAGNITTKSVNVLVSHDQSKK